MPHPPFPPPDVAELIAAKLCHDLMGPAGAVRSALELLAEDPDSDGGGEALELAAAGARRLVSLIAFARTAYGGAGGAASGEALGRLAREALADARPTLVWEVAGEVAEVPARVALHLAQIAIEATFAGGAVRVSGERRPGWFVVGVEAEGLRARLLPEVLAGLRAEGPVPVPAGRWAQGWLVQALVATARGRLEVTDTPGRVCMRASFPD